MRETHIDHLGESHTIDYLATATTDTAALMAARVPLIENMLADEEASRILLNA